jgi:hypothetical protein
MPNNETKNNAFRTNATRAHEICATIIINLIVTNANRESVVRRIVSRQNVVAPVCLARL